MRDQRERLRDILEAVERIQRHATKGRQAFEQDELLQVWVVHHLQIIGEGAARLGQEFHNAHPVLPWPQIVAMRNVLVHEYFGVDLNEVWNIVERELPDMKRQIEAILKELGLPE